MRDHFFFSCQQNKVLVSNTISACVMMIPHEAMNPCSGEINMRICRVLVDNLAKLAFYDESGFATLENIAQKAGKTADWTSHANLIDCLQNGKHHKETLELFKAFETNTNLNQGKYLVPVPSPNKILLLAGNYAEHIKEGGGMAVERNETFPYVFMKPPTTTLNDPYKPVLIPSISPDAIDWELELGVIIGAKCKSVKESDALKYVAGYTIINDISNRKFRPNPGRKKRDRDTFFDWLHGKWFDTFCPMGPCALDAGTLPDPQNLKLELKLNGETRQNSSTSQMIFSVAALIEFISSMVTLEPGDIISTGTPSGVGHTTGTFLKPGDQMTGFIEKIGTLTTTLAAEPK